MKIARSWVGTPFCHQMRKKGRGCDCAGLILGISQELGLSFDEDFISYHHERDSYLLEIKLEKYFFPTCLKLGSIAFFEKKSWGSHVGIITNYPNKKYALLHACMKRGAVVEHRFLPELMQGAKYFDFFKS